ncbi:MAG: hypothetical protein GWN61_23415, partial [candidate division Zixibacteria bacterium]|nr:HAMP domain-containing histidine kinase [candidate division KSB1 bacterium]NIR67544.1 HAMP domain-containing histidine kinase [candidate division Zixibacteria bacterium]NIS45194.1 HAMP domain-containing histidine kinase [candidate division Zixibacteria bacterium]NIT72101.1 HAMP domain-containing histidine kinase [candidate division KSB1 bacterium]NIU12972.1 HAMP domain-containing histidine kinase [candidate division Zixibacteria bacterium]
MSEPSDSKVNRNKKDTRIRYLEDLARWNMYSLELLASLGELHRSASNERSPKNIFSIANQHLVNILKFETVAFYLVKEDDSEFALHYIEPQESNAFVLKEVNRRIEDGTFAWAVNQNRTVVMETDDEDKTFIMHVLATQKRVRGMFVGVLDKSLNPLENNLQLTLSIILQNTALALESVSLYNLFYEANALLENRVRERTTDLEDHLVLLQEEISSRKLAEESLWAAREEAELKMSSKYLLLTQASHELKRPIQSMMACARMIREERAGSGAVDGKRMDKLQPVELAGRKALELIDVIDDLIFNKTSSLKNQIEPLDLDRLLNEVQAAVVPLEQESEYNIEVKIAPDLDVVESD